MLKMGTAFDRPCRSELVEGAFRDCMLRGGFGAMLCVCEPLCVQRKDAGGRISAHLHADVMECASSCAACALTWWKLGLLRTTRRVVRSESALREHERASERRDHANELLMTSDCLPHHPPAKLWRSPAAAPRNQSAVPRRYLLKNPAIRPRARVPPGQGVIPRT